MEKIHIFEKSGLGKAPFKFLRVESLPSPALLEANPDAYNNAMKALTPGCRHGSCAYCGMPLTHNYLVRSADDRMFVVGSECVAKTDDRGLMDAAREARLQIERDKREAKRALERKAREAEVERILEEQRAVNGGLTNAELALKNEREKTERLVAILGPIADELDDGRHGFRGDVAGDLRKGNIPYGRGRDLTAEIIAKKYGKKDSEAYVTKYAEITKLFEAAVKIK